MFTWYIYERLCIFKLIAILQLKQVQFNFILLWKLTQRCLLVRFHWAIQTNVSLLYIETAAYSTPSTCEIVNIYVFAASDHIDLFWLRVCVVLWYRLKTVWKNILRFQPQFQAVLLYSYDLCAWNINIMTCLLSRTCWKLTKNML